MISRLVAFLLCLFCLGPIVSAQTTIHDLVMWDYRGTSPSHKPLPDYHEWLLEYCKTNTPERLVLYVSSPCIDTDFETFYDPEATASTATPPPDFISFLDQLKKQSETSNLDVEILFDRSSFPMTGPSAACWTGSASSQPSLPLPPQWSGLALGLDWYGDVLANASLAANPIVGLTIDPEVDNSNHTTAIPGSTCVEPVPDKYRVQTIYQQLIDYVDNWRVLNGHQAKTSGMALEVDSSSFAKINASDFPMSAELMGLVNVNASFELNNCRLSNGYPSWRPNVPSPLLDRVYLEVYVACSRDRQTQTIYQAGSFWRWQNDNGCEDGHVSSSRSPASAAEALRLNMTQLPGSPGPGQLAAKETSATPNHIEFEGTDTMFLNWEDYTRVCAVNANGSTTPSAAFGGAWKFRVSPQNTNTSAFGYGPHLDTAGQSLPYRYSELVMDWRSPKITSEMASRICLVFSAERNVLLPFFGYWDLADFYSFIDALKVQTDGSDADHSIYQDMNGNPLAAAPNWGIYDLQTALTAWPSLGSYPAAELDCLGDINLDRRVDLDDILLMIHLWGMAGGDANGDDQTDVEDLLVILANFDQECS